MPDGALLGTSGAFSDCKMETLRAYLTPKAKKQRLENEDESEREISDDEGMAESGEEKQDQPGWARAMQREILQEMRSMIRPIAESVEELKTEISNAKLEVRLARAEAEEALTQAELAHGAAEETANLARDLETKVSDIQRSMITMKEVQKMIADAISKNQSGSFSPSTLPNYSSSDKSRLTPEKTEQLSRTIVVGGFEQDSMKKDVETKVNQLVSSVGGVEDVYAYRRGSLGFVRFTEASAMWKFLKEFNSMDNKPYHNGRKIWAAVSRSPQDRKKGRTLAAYKRVIAEVGLAKVDEIDYDSRRGLLWIGKRRVAEWQVSEERLEIDASEMRAAGVVVDSNILTNAVAEAMGTQ